MNDFFGHPVPAEQSTGQPYVLLLYLIISFCFYRSVVVAKLLYASGRVLPTLQIGTKFNRSSTRVKEMDTVHSIYLILIICAPQ